MIKAKSYFKKSCARVIEEAMSMRVSEVMGPPFPVLDIKTPLRLAIPLLQQCQGVLTSQGGQVTGIVTNIDVGKGYEAAVKARAD
jgi:predicted transcriptional regulator